LNFQKLKRKHEKRKNRTNQKKQKKPKETMETKSKPSGRFPKPGNAEEKITVGRPNIAFHWKVRVRVNL
jgi:hypothetical protein